MNEEWKSPAEGDAWIAKMKEGCTHFVTRPSTGRSGHGSGGRGDADDATTLATTLSDVGMAMRSRLDGKAEQRPDAKPKVNNSGI